LPRGPNLRLSGKPKEFDLQSYLLKSTVSLPSQPAKLRTHRMAKVDAYLGRNTARDEKIGTALEAEHEAQMRLRYGVGGGVRRTSSRDRPCVKTASSRGLADEAEANNTRGNTRGAGRRIWSAESIHDNVAGRGEVGVWPRKGQKTLGQ
jgi:hypothetical protein